MTETLRWWLAATVIGVIATPYAFRLFRFLPDRGYTLARTLGIVLVVYPLWLLAVLGLVPYSAGPAVLLLGLLAAGAIALAGRDRQALAAHLRAHAALIVTAEVVFAAVLIGLGVLRAYAPAIDATEKLFEFSLFNGVLHSTRMPPADPWFGGEPISYYYGGYLVVALFTKLTGVPAAYAFNLGVVLTGALVAVSVFGLAANLVLSRLRIADGGSRQDRGTRGVSRAETPSVQAGGSAAAARGPLAAPQTRAPGDGAGAPPGSRAAIRGPQSAIRWALVGGVLSVVLMLVIGNLEGAFELAAARGWLSPESVQRLGIVNLTGLVRTGHWYPDEFWFWWRATRLGSDWNILEFPFFSFMLGDLHAHVLVLPYTLLGLAAVLNLLRGGQPLGLDAVRRQPVTVVFLGVAAGMLALCNSWDAPIFIVLLAGAALTLNIGRDGLTGRALAQTAAFVLPVGALAFGLFLPFWLNLHAATGSIHPVELNNLTPGINGEGMVLPPHHFLIAWGPLLLVTGSGIVAQAVRRHAWRAPNADWNLALTLTFAPLVVWGMTVVIVHRSFVALVAEVQARSTSWTFGSYWAVQLVLLFLIMHALVVVLAEARRPHHERRAARIYMLLTAALGLLILHGIELFYLLEPAIPSRINTIFKFSFIVWLLLASAGGAAVVDVLLPWWRRGGRPAAAAWVAALAAVLLLALVYPATAAMSRTDGFTGTPTLDGLAFLRRSDPDEYAAIAWLRDNLPGRPTILEAAGPNYSLSGRVSARTGFLTVMGWQGHEAKLRGGRDYAASEARVNQRAADVEEIYQTTSLDAARDMLRRYGVDYVYVGRLELERYGAAGMDKFQQLGEPVYRNRSVTVYRVTEQAPALGSGR